MKSNGLFLLKIQKDMIINVGNVVDELNCVFQLDSSIFVKNLLSFKAN